MLKPLTVFYYAWVEKDLKSEGKEESDLRWTEQEEEDSGQAELQEMDQPPVHAHLLQYPASLQVIRPGIRDEGAYDTQTA